MSYTGNVFLLHSKGVAEVITGAPFLQLDHLHSCKKKQSKNEGWCSGNIPALYYGNIGNLEKQLSWASKHAFQESGKVVKVELVASTKSLHMI
jgi:hypothetical protein